METHRSISSHFLSVFLLFYLATPLISAVAANRPYFLSFLNFLGLPPGPAGDFVLALLVFPFFNSPHRPLMVFAVFQIKCQNAFIA